MGSSFDIARSQEVCALTGKAFSVGEVHIAVLLEVPGETSMTRVLYDIEAWEEQIASEDGVVYPDGATKIGFWKRVSPEPGDSGKKSPLVSDDEIMDLFETLEEATDEKQLAFRYLLALMLMRKKKLELERMEPADDEHPHPRLVLRQKVTKSSGIEGAVFHVSDPKLDDEAINQANEELGQVINIEGT